MRETMNPNQRLSDHCTLTTVHWRSIADNYPSLAQTESAMKKPETQLSSREAMRCRKTTPATSQPALKIKNVRFCR
jgi:hypothetical protein